MQEERGACDKRRTAEETLPSHPAHRQGTAPLNGDTSSPYTTAKLRKPPSMSRKPQPLGAEFPQASEASLQVVA